MVCFVDWLLLFMQPSDFWIADWHIQPQLNRIRGNDETVQIEPRIMDVLVLLAQTPGQVVRREELLETVWSNRFVGEEALTRSISELRKVFGDNPRKPHVIETIRKSGYRLIAPVQIKTQQTAALAETSTALNQTITDVWTDLRKPSYIYGALGIATLLFGLAWWLTRPSPASPTPRMVPLTSYPGLETAPQLSPDGKQVAFVWTGMDGNNDVYIKLIGTEQPFRLTDSPAADLYPTWSPDGNQIAFARVTDSSCVLLSKSALGGPERRLTTCSVGSYPAPSWSPDGRWLVFNDRPSPTAPYRLIRFSFDTEETVALTHPPEQYMGDTRPLFSPDASPLQIAFKRTNLFGIMDLYVLPISGGTPTRLTSDNLKIRGHTWDASGTHIIFSSNRTGPYNLWKVGMTGTEPELFFIGDHIHGLSYAQDHHRLVHETWQVDINLWALDLPARPTNVPTQFVSSTRWDAHAVFSPDGSRLAFASTRSGTPEIWMSDADGSNLVRLTSFGGAFTSAPQWSPNGERIVLSSRAQGNADLYVLDPEGGLPQRLTHNTSIDVNPTWSRNGEWIYFGSNRSGSWQLWKMAYTGVDTLQVTDDGGYFAQESEDGQSLYYTRLEQPGLWKRALSETESRLLIPDLGSAYERTWTIHNHAIYYIASDDEASATLQRFDLSTHASSSLYTFSRELTNSGLGIAPNGTTLLFAQVDQQESDLTLIEHFQR